MTTIFRSGLCRLTLNSFNSKLILNNGSDFQISIVRGIAGQELRDMKCTPPRPKPWPYQTKRFNYLHYLYDLTTNRFNENSKIIVVEGPIAAGKTQFAKELAKDLDMLYLPEANLDMLHTNEYGYNTKQLDDMLPEPCKSFDVMDFLKNPKNRLAARFQIEQYCTKYSQYIDALAHLLNTGQGVVLDRCVYSDFVFLEAMYASKFISKGVRNYYYELRRNTISELMRPHLVIYLDIPVDCVREKIKKRNVNVEVCSTAMTPNYIRCMEDAYKQSYLSEISKHAELLVYDWSDAGEVEVVIEDVERINFDKYDVHDPKMKDWALSKEEDWACARNKYTDKKHDMINLLNCVPAVHVPELLNTGDDAQAHLEAIENAPGNVYQVGYNKDMGDTGLLFKVGLRANNRGTLPLIERQFC